MSLDPLTAPGAVELLEQLPQTTHVSILPGPDNTCTLLWVLRDGSRHHLRTVEEVDDVVDTLVPV